MQFTDSRMQFALKGIGLLYAIHEKSKSSRTSLKTEEKFRKQHDKMYLSELERRLQCCLRKIPIASEAVQVAIPQENPK